MYRTLDPRLRPDGPAVVDGPRAEVRRHPLHPRGLPQGRTTRRSTSRPIARTSPACRRATRAGPGRPRSSPGSTMDYGPSLAPDRARSATTGPTSPTRGSRSGSTPARGASRAAGRGPSSTTTRSASPRGGPATGFIDWNGINFNGRHEVHPRVAGLVEFANPTGPGWADPATGTFDDPRLRGRDGRPYGPLPRSWAHYRGLYRHGDRVILAYTVGQTDVLEMPGVEMGGPTPAFSRTFNLGPRETPMVLQVARGPAARLRTFESGDGAEGAVAFLGPEPGPTSISPREATPVRFDGSTHVEVAKPGALDLARGDFTIAARFKTRRGGSLFAETAPRRELGPRGKTLFVRNGRLVFDIGWVGAVESRRPGRRRRVARRAVLTYEHATGRVCLFIDGSRDGRRSCPPRVPSPTASSGSASRPRTSPRPASYFDGRIAEVRFYKQALGPEEAASIMTRREDDARLVARWRPDEARGGVVRDETGHGHDGTGRPTGLASGPRRGHPGRRLAPGPRGSRGRARPRATCGSRSRPARSRSVSPLRLVRVPSEGDPKALASSIKGGPATDLAALTRGGPARWPDALKTTIKPGGDDGPFAVDVLTPARREPVALPDAALGPRLLPRRAARSPSAPGTATSGASTGSTTPPAGLTWRRFACGLFQPLGLKIVDGVVHVSLPRPDRRPPRPERRRRGRLLRELQQRPPGHRALPRVRDGPPDRRGGELLLRQGRAARQDGRGPAARHAPEGRPRRLPHRDPRHRLPRPERRLPQPRRHRSSSTDQEGFWLPKNRINRVVRGGFYGNMWGYHDVTDPSDSAMEPPVCWITNAFDRSPAEPVWVELGRRGAR